MRKIFTSAFVGNYESAERVILYELENEDEFWEVETRENDYELEEKLGLYSDGNVPPGATFTRYTFELLGTSHLAVTETEAMNV